MELSRMRVARLEASRIWPPLRTYLLASGAANLVWEVSQMPLYSLWESTTGREIAFAALHCTGGDLLIAAATLGIGVLLTGQGCWPESRWRQVTLATIGLGLAYTVFSEWFNIEVRRTWAYSPMMPTLPGLGTGIAPLLQWAAISSLALYLARRARPSGPVIRQP